MESLRTHSGGGHSCPPSSLTCELLLQDDPLQNVDNQPETTVLTVVTAEITVTTAETPPTTMDPLTTTQSTTEPVTTMRTTSVVKQESTANTDILPHHLGPTGIRPKTTPKAIVTTVPMVVTEERTLDNSVVYALVILTLGVIVLVLCCFYCCLRVSGPCLHSL